MSSPYFPGYDGPRPNPLTRQEGANLSVELGRAHRGDDYTNADVYGKVLNFGGRNYLGAVLERDPEAFRAKIDNQIADLQGIIAPHVGRYATAKHRQIGVFNESDCDLWERFYGRSKVMHVSGIILGVAGVALRRRMIYDIDNPGKIDNAREFAYGGKDFRIGVLFDTTDMEPYFCYRVEAPDTDEMLVPIRGFPRSSKEFHGLWSWQIAGSDVVRTDAIQHMQ